MHVFNIFSVCSVGFVSFLDQFFDFIYIFFISELFCKVVLAILFASLLVVRSVLRHVVLDEARTVQSSQAVQDYQSRYSEFFVFRSCSILLVR